MDEKSFDVKRIAEGYRDRPFLHKIVIEEFQKEFGYQNYENGLDVGCGAGLSTKALKMICKNVIGTDISEEMITVAKEVCDSDGYNFFTSSAECIPKPNKQYDIVTGAGMVQWVNIELFLKCIAGIMESHGMLFIYDFGITERMVDDNGYKDWWNRQYLVKFPKPYRNETVWKQEDVQPYGFRIAKQVKYDMEYEFTLEAFVNFMMIQSNVNAKIEDKSVGLEDAQRWFTNSLRPFFQEKTRTLIFSGYSWYIEKI